jgi:hypothetical protein
MSGLGQIGYHFGSGETEIEWRTKIPVIITVFIGSLVAGFAMSNLAKHSFGRHEKNPEKDR